MGPIETCSWQLSVRIAFVTGGSRGIDKAVARVPARTDARAAVNYRTRAADAEAVCADIKGMGGQAIAIQADVSIGREVARMGQQATDGL
jgi:3-oxoacyl-[acyl-carrier protein] reductase